jgi:hypothetical protein
VQVVGESLDITVVQGPDFEEVIRPNASKGDRARVAGLDRTPLSPRRSSNVKEDFRQARSLVENGWELYHNFYGGWQSVSLGTIAAWHMYAGAWAEGGRAHDPCGSARGVSADQGRTRSAMATASKNNWRHPVQERHSCSCPNRRPTEICVANIMAARDAGPVRCGACPAVAPSSLPTEQSGQI